MAQTVSQAKKKQTIARSITEAEYVAVSHAVQEAILLLNAITELSTSEKNYPIRIYCDNKSVIDLSKNSVHHVRIKHIDVQHHFARNAIKEGSRYGDTLEHF